MDACGLAGADPASRLCDRRQGGVGIVDLGSASAVP